MSRTILVSQAAEILGVSRQRIHFLLRRGDLKGSKVAGTWVIEEKSVKQWKPGGSSGRSKNKLTAKREK